MFKSVHYNNIVIMKRGDNPNELQRLLNQLWYTSVGSKIERMQVGAREEGSKSYLSPS